MNDERKLFPRYLLKYGTVAYISIFLILLGVVAVILVKVKQSDIYISNYTAIGK